LARIRVAANPIRAKKPGKTYVRGRAFYAITNGARRRNQMPEV
jgi:hypothetical protein